MWIIIFSSRGLLPRLRGKRNNPIQHPHLYEQHNNSCTQTHTHTHFQKQNAWQKCESFKIFPFYLLKCYFRYFLKCESKAQLTGAECLSWRVCWPTANRSTGRVSGQSFYTKSLMSISPFTEYMMTGKIWTNTYNYLFLNNMKT